MVSLERFSDGNRQQPEAADKQHQDNSDDRELETGLSETGMHDQFAPVVTLLLLGL
jgi:hypothetical protein